MKCYLKKSILSLLESIGFFHFNWLKIWLIVLKKFASSGRTGSIEIGIQRKIYIERKRITQKKQRNIGIFCM